MDWFKGKSTGKPHDLHGKIDGFRLRFSPTNQSIDLGESIILSAQIMGCYSKFVLFWSPPIHWLVKNRNPQEHFAGEIPLEMPVFHPNELPGDYTCALGIGDCTCGFHQVFLGFPKFCRSPRKSSFISVFPILMLSIL